VNDEYATKLAIDMKLNQGDVVTWLYKQEVCSKTIDGNSSATKKN